MMGVAPEHNLIYRAAQALKRAAGINLGALICIDKKIPLGAGLGGGSSNAATTLIALNHLWELHWTHSQLKALALTLGADVPFFIHGHAAWGEGIGEKLTSVELDEPWVLVITPPCQVNTAKIFAHPDLTRNTSSFRIGNLATDEVQNHFSQLKNDFEPLVRRIFPEVDSAMKWLSNFGKAQLSGSGSSVFACFTSLNQAQEVAQQLPQGFKGFVTKGRNKSLLIESIEREAQITLLEPV
jgi:4-diphosphocytidyl-2-C-methyl-D-erythritol kinase